LPLEVFADRTGLIGENQLGGGLAKSLDVFLESRNGLENVLDDRNNFSLLFRMPEQLVGLLVDVKRCSLDRLEVILESAIQNAEAGERFVACSDGALLRCNVAETLEDIRRANGKNATLEATTSVEFLRLVSVNE
jgi:hypothetical protein